MTHASLIVLLFALPASESSTSKPEDAAGPQILNTLSYLPLSAQWAATYGAGPLLVTMPVLVDSELLAARAAAANSPLTYTGLEDAADPTPLPQRVHTASHLQLEWGLATIGPGVLFPHPAATSRGGGTPSPSSRGHSRGGPRPLVSLPPGGDTVPPTGPEPTPGIPGSPGGPTMVPPPWPTVPSLSPPLVPPSLIQLPPDKSVPPGSSPGPTPVPEPTSVLVWVLALVGALVWSQRRSAGAIGLPG